MSKFEFYLRDATRKLRLPHYLQGVYPTLGDGTRKLQGTGDYRVPVPGEFYLVTVEGRGTVGVLCDAQNMPKQWIAEEVQDADCA